jgi:hypothetical protein
MPSVGFEPTIPVFNPVKTVHALDRTAAVIGIEIVHLTKVDHQLIFKFKIAILITNFQTTYPPVGAGLAQLV